MDRDRLGRRRRPAQERGLRPLHPLLPERWASRALRVAMSEADWARFEALVGERSAGAATQARAIGEAIVRLMDEAATAATLPIDRPRPEPRPTDWMDWERRKALRLLHRPQAH